MQIESAIFFDIEARSKGASELEISIQSYRQYVVLRREVRPVCCNLLISLAASDNGRAYHIVVA